MKPADSYREKQRAARADLARLQHEGDALGGLFRRAAGHFSAADARDSRDPVELWGRRIGRTLGAFAILGLCIYLFLAYVR